MNVEPPLAITGLGAISAAGRGLGALHAALLAGRDGLCLRDDPALPLAARVPVAAVDDLAAIGPRGEALARVAIDEALAAARLPAAAMGLAVGSCTGGLRTSEAAYLRDGPAGMDRRHRDQPAGRLLERLQRRYGTGGPATVHVEACASAACALIEAMLWLRSGLVPAVLVVGVDPLTRLTMAGFTALQVVDPAGCRPFTVERAGMSLGEGAVAVVIEDAVHARRRGAPVQASLLGWGLHADGHHGTAPDPAGRWLEQAVVEALADAGMPREAIGFVAAHGTGTRDNDACEATVLGRLFGCVPVASAKRHVGHTMGAAAAFGLVGACLAVREGQLHPNAGGGTAMSEVDVVRVVRETRVEAALVTSLAFGGVDAALVVGGPERCA